MNLVLNNQQLFPVGVTVKAYPVANFPKSKLPPTSSTVPVGAATAEAVVAADGTCTLTGLTEKTRYYAVVEVSAGVYRYVHFTTALAGPGGSGSVAEEKAAREAADATEKARAEAIEALKATATALTTEQSSREGSDATEKARAEAAEAAKATVTALTAETTAREAADGVEKARAEAAEALKLVKASNLSDLANAGTARTNLGLGTAAVLAASAFATPAEVTTEETSRKTQGDLVARNGLQEKYYWAPTFLATEFSSKAMVANTAFYLKFVPHRAMTLRGISFVVNTAAGANDKVAVALYNNNKERVAISAETEGKLNATGRKDIDFTGDVALTAGKTYYAAIQQGAAGGTLAALTGSSLGNVFPIKMFTEEMVEDGAVASSMAPVFPFATLPAASTVSAYPHLFPRER